MTQHNHACSPGESFNTGTFNWQHLLPPQANVTITHGFPSLPDAVAVVANELLTTVMDDRNTPTNMIAASAGPFHAQYREPGAILSEQQLRALGPYTLHGEF